ncbi:ABC transporter permease [Flavihumibacter rivuli]|uniref:ABC transporter permease n=1 Tax=Flavihumibacter rivuli TaxID=2838156 RepID=UPI001BDE2527|nr:ABC transporter permease [Flavihumibacter rivuli]ULQ56293.1 ABC transporter permease [Flavihumibacter rivuli]
MRSDKQYWEWEIGPQSHWLGTSFRELVAYKDLLFGMVRKDFIGAYQQTLLGPFWMLFQPLLSVLVYVIVFNGIIGISTAGKPAFLFYLAGIIIWNFFSDLLLSNASVITANAPIFNKVYFPRLITPLSLVLLQLIRLGINLLLLAGVLFYFVLNGTVSPDWGNLPVLLPIILIMAGFALGGGLVVSVLTAKYRDLTGLLQLIVRLLMFVSPIFYTSKDVPAKWDWVVKFNPLAPLIDGFRSILLGIGSPEWFGLLYSFGLMMLLLLAGIMIFSKYIDRLLDVA